MDIPGTVDPFTPEEWAALPDWVKNATPPDPDADRDSSVKQCKSPVGAGPF